jgi:hypothetical protein
VLVEFFRSESSDEARRIATELGASFLCLYGTQTLAFDGRDWLHPIWDDREIRVFRIDRDGVRPTAPY